MVLGEGGEGVGGAAAGVDGGLVAWAVGGYGGLEM